MPEPTLAYLLIFACAALAAHLVLGAFRRSAAARRAASRRFAGIGPDERAGPAPPPLRGARGGRSGLLAPVAGLERLVLQAGLAVTPARLGLLVAAATLVLALLLPTPEPLGLRLLLAAAIASLSALLVLRIRRGRRLARFGEQLPEVIDVVVRSLRAGHPLPVSLALVARETPEPAGPEFALVVEEVNLGRSIPEALGNLHARVGYPELRFLVAAVSIASGTGGNLGEILSRLSRTLRERFRLRRRIRALSAEGRFSGLALSALPILLFGLINLVGADYYAEFWASPSAGKIAAVAVVLLAVGNLAIYRLVNFKV